MGLLNMVNIMFKDAGDTGIGLVRRGVVCLGVQDKASLVGEYRINNMLDVNTDEKLKGLSESNKTFIRLALVGNDAPPTEVLVVVAELIGDSVSWDPETMVTFKRFESLRFDYLALAGLTTADGEKVATWAKACNALGVHRFKVVMANVAADSERVINFTHEQVTFEGKSYTAGEFCAYVAGFIASTDPLRSITYARLPRVTKVTPLSRKEADARTANGELVLYDDGQQVRMASGVNSLKQLLTDQDDSYKQIKIIEIMDMFHNAVKRAILEKYIGRYTNSYQNKLLLVGEIHKLLQEFERLGLVEVGDGEARVDLETQRAYLKSIGYVSKAGKPADRLSDDEVLRANTKEKVFIRCRFLPLGAIEAVDIVVET